MPPASSSQRRGPSRTDATTAFYIGAVLSLAVALFVYSARRYGLDLDADLVVVGALAVVVVLLGEVVAEGRARLSLWSILLLACQAIVGPAGAGLVGALMGALLGRRLAPRVWIFNAAQDAAIGMLGGLAFVAVGGSTSASDLGSIGEVLINLGLPLLVADIAMFVANTALLTGVLVVSRTGTLRTVIAPLLRSSALPYLGYGVIAFLMTVLWFPAGLGAVSILLVLAPLVVAQWANRQHAEELQAQQRVLEVLVAAVEAKVPHLTGHSARVAELSARIADELGLGPQSVGDTRFAGMLHDVGQTSLPTTVVRQATADDPAIQDYPAVGTRLLEGLGFLRGSLAPIAQHRVALDRPPSDEPGSLPARVVGIADTYDLLTEVGTPDGVRLGHDGAMTELRRRPGVDDRLLRALESAVARRA